MIPDTNDNNPLTIRTTLQPGDLGAVVRLHGLVYSAEYGYGMGFEQYVARGIAEFHASYNPLLDRIWLVEQAGDLLGCLALMHRPGKQAQIRFFVLAAALRGKGLGKQLMELCMRFYAEAGYESAYLWTTSDLPAAAALYRRHGFVLTEAHPSADFGKEVTEQKYELRPHQQ